MLGNQAITAEETPNREGALSLYLSVGGTTCALLSRHAVCEDDQGPDPPSYRPGPGPPNY